MSDKNLPAVYNNRAFALVTTIQPENTTDTPHSDFVKEIEKTFNHPHDAINAGLHPFKAYREDVGETTYNVAKILDCSEEEYNLMESGELDLKVEDVLKFCQNFNIQPYDLIPHDAGAASGVMRDAMLDVYNGPSLLSTSCEHTKETLFLLLMDEALPTQSTIKLKRIRDRFKDQELYGLTIAFVDFLLKHDGSLHTGYIDDHHNLLENFLDEARSSTVALDTEKEKDLTRKKEEAHALYNHLGQRLYRDKWVETHTRLLTAKKVMKKKEQFYKSYENSPSVLGLDTWPEHGSIIVQGKRHMNWKQAHKRHVIALRRYDDALLAIADNTRLQKNIEKQITALEVWAKAKADLLQRYTNRQVIMYHHDFRAVQPSNASFGLIRVISKTSLPNINGVDTLDIQTKEPNLRKTLLGQIVQGRKTSFSFQSPSLKQMFTPK